MRILIIRNAYQKDTGGAEQYAFNLALALKNEGHSPLVVTRHTAIHDKCRAADLPYISGPWNESQEWSRWYYLRRAYTILWYLWVILTRRIDIVHPQSRDDFVFATDAGKLLKKRIVWTDHADLKYIMDRVNHPHPRMQSWILKAADYTSAIMCVSNSEKASIMSVFPEAENKLITVYNGVFKQEVHPIKKSGFVVGTNARLVPEKGIAELMEAFSISTRAPSELWLVGGLSGNENAFKQLASTLGIAERTKFIGYVENPQDYMASMDVFVHASYHEAFSLAVIEACMLGRPVIATAVGGTPEIITKETGVLVEPKSTQQIADALRKLIADPALAKRLGSKAQETARTSFEFSKIVSEKIIPIYKGEHR